ncbi:hypothetical protein SSX86_002355 [Deinandra increscens subsp. villosa]|uniref:Non-haem dioxygenase N-terminal domain-containing protein n=1 Tax=Deinandra increscens subsp. villosa TaxID=3103831 RepID=A0AAP0H7Y2_9ASTR
MPSQSKLPVINLNSQTLNSSNHALWLSTSHVVRRALEDYGCFVVSTDKIPSDKRETMFELSKDLFCLPMETKVKNCSPVLGFGYGKYASLPLYESFGIENGATVDATRSFTDLLFLPGTMLSVKFQCASVEYLLFRFFSANSDYPVLHLRSRRGVDVLFIAAMPESEPLHLVGAYTTVMI